MAKIIVRRASGEDELFRAIPFVSAGRYVIISVCYLATILCATVAAVILVVALAAGGPSLPGASSTHLPITVAALASTGGLGAFLHRVDRAERHSMRCERLLAHLTTLPPSPATESAIIQLTQLMSRM